MNMDENPNGKDFWDDFTEDDYFEMYWSDDDD